MIGLAMEMPTAFLDLWTGLTDLDFALAHRVLSDKQYTTHYANRPKGRELILDNSMHELGYPLPLHELRYAAELVHADVVIAPDRLGEAAANLQRFKEAQPALKEFQIGVVMCGRTGTERTLFLHEVRSAAVLCLPFREPRFDWFSEHDAQILATWKRIHLLGVNELGELKRFSFLAGRRPEMRWTVDTAKPIKWGVESRHLSSLRTLRGAPLSTNVLLDLDADALTVSQMQVIEANIRTLRRICR